MHTTREYVEVTTKRCFVCRAGGVIHVPSDEFEKWQSGLVIQAAMPSVSVEAREQLISGTHPVCWDRMFGGDGDDEPTPAAAALVHISDLFNQLG